MVSIEALEQFKKLKKEALDVLIYFEERREKVRELKLTAGDISEALGRDKEEVEDVLQGLLSNKLVRVASRSLWKGTKYELMSTVEGKKDELYQAKKEIYDK